MTITGRYVGRLVAVAAILLIAACTESKQKTDYAVYRGGVLYESEEAYEANKMFSGKAGNIFGSEDEDEGGGGPSGIGVNSFLWRASLDTLSFMPLASADPFGGVIITDWYATPGSPLERFKMTVYILDRKLRADAVKVAVFRQSRPAPGAEWMDATIAKATPFELENAILTRARQLRVANLEPGQ